MGTRKFRAARRDIVYNTTDLRIKEKTTGKVTSAVAVEQLPVVSKKPFPESRFQKQPPKQFKETIR
jgi:hypothetical protein